MYLNNKFRITKWEMIVVIIVLMITMFKSNEIKLNITCGPILLTAISVSCLESIFRLLSYWSGENEAGRCGSPHSAVFFLYEVDKWRSPPCTVGLVYIRLLYLVAQPVQLVQFISDWQEWQATLHSQSSLQIGHWGSWQINYR